MTYLYLDTCAAVKLFKQEEHSETLKAWIAAQMPNQQITSHLTQTELRRALHAMPAPPELHERANIWLNRCALVNLTPEVLKKAGNLAPDSRLRSLDALHVAAALELGAALTYFVTYDNRLATAAKEHGLPVVTPT